jgi:hypothetical protein
VNFHLSLKPKSTLCGTSRTLAETERKNIFSGLHSRTFLKTTWLQAPYIKTSVNSQTELNLWI